MFLDESTQKRTVFGIRFCEEITRALSKKKNCVRRYFVKLITYPFDFMHDSPKVDQSATATMYKLPRYVRRVCTTSCVSLRILCRSHTGLVETNRAERTFLLVEPIIYPLILYRIQYR